MNILQINASVRGAASHSSRLAGDIVARLQATEEKAALTLRDLARDPAGTLDEAALQALFTPVADRTPAQAERVAQADAVIAQVQAADVIVLGVPMYNFGVPSSLKDWIDALARAGVTFKYTDRGSVGLLTGKKVYVALARGGLYRDTPADTQVPYLRAVLGFMGLTDVSFIYAEGLNMGPEAERQGLASAREQIDALLPEAVAA